MNMNPMKLFQLKSGIGEFKNAHPKFPLFLKAVSENALREGAVLECKITDPEGKAYQSNLKLTASDIELIGQLRELLRDLA